ncbi:hypothetical protein [Methylocystis sp. S23]
MAFKKSAFVALVAIPVVCGFGAMAEEVKWGAPNVAGQPGYKEPPKVDEIRGPRPAKDDPKNKGSYQVKRDEAK